MPIKETKPISALLGVGVINVSFSHQYNARSIKIYPLNLIFKRIYVEPDLIKQSLMHG